MAERLDEQTIALRAAREFQDGKESASSERAVIRGDSVIYIST